MNDETEVLSVPYVRSTLPDASSISVGQRLVMDHQVYTILRVDPCRRRDGSIRTMITWSAPCADCGEIFYGTSVCGGGMPTRRCFTHRTGGRPVRGFGLRQRVNVEWLPPEQAGAAPATTGPSGA